MKKYRILGMILAFTLLVVCIIILYQPVSFYLSNPEKFKVMLKEKGSFAALIIFLLQILQVIIAFIPSDTISLISGYILGTWLGFIISYLGIMIGSFLAFYLARFFGRPLVMRFVKKEKLDKIEAKLNSKTTTKGIFLMSFIPFFPRDVLVYALGMSPINPKKFFIIYALARFPLIFLMSFTGDSLYFQKELSYVATCVFILYLLYLIAFKKRS